MQNPFSLSFGKEPISIIDRDLQNEVEQQEAENSMLINRQYHQYHFADSTLLLENMKLRKWLFPSIFKGANPVW